MRQTAVLSLTVNSKAGFLNSSIWPRPLSWLSVQEELGPICLLFVPKHNAAPLGL